VNFSPEKLLLVGVIALVVLGPNRLPQAARSVGRVVAELRRMSASFQHEVNEAIGEPRDAINGAVGNLGLTDLRETLRNGVTGAFTTPAPSASPTAAGASPATAGASPPATPGPPAAVPAPPAAAPISPPDDPAFN